ncbi:MAG: DUF72 domain-containing protein [Candidatus Limnocylindrales bacterium]|jgi:uncharacterized protein YecE (DUF72 family)
MPPLTLDDSATSNLHDPGSDVAGERALPVERAAIDPLVTRSGATIRIGTASWTDPTMTAPGVFYPRGADGAEERLTYYAGTFPIVEVDATYYALPSARVAAAWVDRTPPDFVFDAKAHALMTGQPTETKRLPKDLRAALPGDLAAAPRTYARDLPSELRDEVWRLYLAGLEPVRASGQLGSVLLQYPRWFFPTSESRDLILEARERLGQVRSAVEFRSETWFNKKNLERTLSFLADHSIPLVMVDGPQGLRSSVPPLTAVTSRELAVIRFHGRRVETWEAAGIPVVERFRYLYSEAEMREWVPRIREAAEEAREMHVLMNNCYANYGSTNARELASMLAAELGAEPERPFSKPERPFSKPADPEAR